MASLWAQHLLFVAATYISTAEAGQPGAPAPIPAPLRELPWGQLNFLHTTDTHGWHGGHLQEAQYAGDWGDYISFAQHLRQRADEDGSDLLVIDSGDRVEGNGLYDASDPKGQYTFDIIKHQTVDVLTTGNHELYKQNTSENEYANVVPAFKGSYIASNVDIYRPKDGKRVALAPRYRKFTTKNQGIRIVAFGFLFNFKGSANNTIVQEVQETVKEQWFRDAVRDKDVDLFVITAHAPVRGGPEIDAIYKAIRDATWDTPIAFFGGHTHIRDYRKLENCAYALESGRYMETLGFLSISGIKPSKKDVIGAESSLDYRRLYIDNNLYSLQHHSGTNSSTFDTELGKNVSQAIAAARKTLKLDHAFGCAPHDFWLNRAPYPSNDSILTLLETRIIPDAFKSTGKPSIVLANSGAIRFDIFKGPFTIDSTYVVSPFTSGFRGVPNVPYDVASKVLKLLNNEGPIILTDLLAQSQGENAPQLDELRPGYLPAGSASVAHAVRLVQESAVRDFGNERPQTVFDNNLSSKTKIQGYTTVDDGGRDGDDTIHDPIVFYNVPNCISANSGFTTSSDDDKTPAKVDLVYNEFIQNWVLLALQFLGEKRDVGDTVSVLGGKTMTDVISEWVQGNWACEK